MNGPAGLAWALLLVTASIAGCVTDRGEGEAMPEVPTASAPDWVPGQWWAWRVEHPLTGTTRTVQTVVTAEDRDAYRVGAMTMDGALTAVVLHVPPLGLVTKPDRSWEIHEEPADLLRFPIHDGKRWEGSIEGEPLTFSARSVASPGMQDEVAFAVTGSRADGSKAVAYTYAPGPETFLHLVRYTQGGRAFMNLTLTDHGLNETAPAFVLTVDDLFLGATGSPEPRLAPPTWPAVDERFTVPEEGDALLVASFMGGGPGMYRVDYRAPDGNTGTLGHDNPTGNDDVVLRTVQEEIVPGEWETTLLAGGAGFVFAEVQSLHISEERPSVG